MAASVVLLPAPVAPTIKIKPRFSMIRSAKSGDTLSESSEGTTLGTNRITTA